MKKNTFILIFLFCIATVKGQEPSITMTTAKAVGETVSFKLATSNDNTTIQVDFGDGTKIDKIIGTSLIAISSTLVGSQTIKIYGQGIMYIDCSFNQLTTLDIVSNTSLKELYCHQNLLTTIDVSSCVVLERLSCHNNLLTTLDVSNNIALKSLLCYFNQLTALDLSNNSSLSYFNCRFNQILTLDVSNKTDLLEFDCSNNQLTTLVVFNNSSLIDLSCSFNQLKTLDVRNNTALQYLNCLYNHLTKLDVSTNSALKFLNCTSNQLTTLDVSTNSALIFLYCSVNQLTTLDVSNNTILKTLWCFGNNLTFDTLPFNHSAWSNFNYVGQNPIFIGTVVNVGDEIDLSSQLIVNGNTTIYNWKTKDGTTLTDGVDYTITNGKTVFLKSQADSVYCEMTNATFPDFTGNNALKTSYVKVLSSSTFIKSDNLKEDGLYIYPNPAKNIINVEGIDLQNADLSIYNAFGKLMLQQKTGNENTQVNISQLPNGVYMLQITNGTRELVRKIIKE